MGDEAISSCSDADANIRMIAGNLISRSEISLPLGLSQRAV